MTYTCFCFCVQLLQAEAIRLEQQRDLEGKVAGLMSRQQQLRGMLGIVPELGS